MSFAKRLADQTVEPGCVCLFWLGQAGFALKTETGRVILIDPYLTDGVYQSFSAENGYAFKRLSAPIADPEDLCCDEIYISHEHRDHLDAEAYPVLSRRVVTKIFCSDVSAGILRQRMVEDQKLVEMRPGEVWESERYRVQITRANHGELCPTACGFLFDFGFIRIYYSGDTCYDTAIVEEISAYQPEICLLPINGAFGNMDHRAAVKFAREVGAKVLIPCHFWTFPLHLGDPLELIRMFEDAAKDKKEDAGPTLKLLMPGEAYVVWASGGR